MIRKVVCRKLNKEVEGLINAPFPGKIGKFIFDNISKKVWDEWQFMQMRIINEYRLNLFNQEHRKKIFQEMIKFLNIKNL